MGQVSLFYSEAGPGRSGGIFNLSSADKTIFDCKICDQKTAENIFKDTPVIITGFTKNKKENIAVTPTLGKDIFLYVGGETGWEILIEGVALINDNNKQGLDELLKNYNKYNVKNYGKPLLLTISGSVYKGYLHAVRIRSEIQYIAAFSFSLLFVGVESDGSANKFQST